MVGVGGVCGLKRLNVYLESDLAELLEQWARVEGRSRGRAAARLIEAGLRRDMQADEELAVSSNG